MIYENEPIHTVKLYGSLRKKFGDSFRMSGHSAAATIRGYALQNPAFHDALVHGLFRVLRGKSLKDAIPYGREEVGAEIGSNAQTFYLIPVVGGAKGGFFNIIAGVFIMAAAIITAIPTAGGSFAAAMGAETAIFGITYGTFALFGLGLTLVGISQMTAKAPKTGDMQREKENASAVISGPQNTAEQGVAIPLVYGKTRTGSVVVASSLTAVDYSERMSDVTFVHAMFELLIKSK